MGGSHRGDDCQPQSGTAGCVTGPGRRPTAEPVERHRQQRRREAGAIIVEGQNDDAGGGLVDPYLDLMCPS